MVANDRMKSDSPEFKKSKNSQVTSKQNGRKNPPIHDFICVEWAVEADSNTTNELKYVGQEPTIHYENREPL